MLSSRSRIWNGRPSASSMVLRRSTHSPPSTSIRTYAPRLRTSTRLPSLSIRAAWATAFASCPAWTTGPTGSVIGRPAGSAVGTVASLVITTSFEVELDCVCRAQAGLGERHVPREWLARALGAGTHHLPVLFGHVDADRVPGGRGSDLVHGVLGVDGDELEHEVALELGRDGQQRHRFPPLVSGLLASRIWSAGRDRCVAVPVDPGITMGVVTAGTHHPDAHVLQDTAE